ncbi:MAG TPA: DUF4124 domain-containing protein [Ottowia sp.]|uniref:DUF4124 domain-containing protein n=1 Tax=Ottowia sp. TaxID=1898956 RepID=UPI002CACADCE|nr:DUF4124 domain-containing protein [Ottowia sp.]HMN19850.1 DUF4124 domain-containing protein [Ottowia sp.]
MDMNWPAFLLALALALPGSASAAALYKCAATDGSVTFQQAPCAAGNGTRLEAGDAFGVRPPRPGQRVAVVLDSPAQQDSKEPEIVGQTAKGKPIYAGPHGGRYTLSGSGRKNYLPKSGESSNDPPATAARSAKAHAEVHIGARGGCYTVGSTGRKSYLPADRCPRD